MLRCPNIARVRWGHDWKVDKAGYYVVKPKAGPVARALSQKHTVDFMETFSPNS